MTNYSEFLVDYYCYLQASLLEANLITVISGTQTDTPILKGSIINEVSTIEIVNYNKDLLYYSFGEGIHHRSHKIISWVLPKIVGDYTLKIYAAKEGEVLSIPGKFRSTVFV